MTVEDVISEWAADPPAEFVLAVEAHLIVERLRQDDPDSLDKWLSDHAEELVARKLKAVVLSDRSTARARTGPRTFAQYREAVEAGEDVDFDPLMVRYCVDESNRWKPLGDMFKPECLYVADDRERRAKANQMEAAFMRAIAKRLKEGQVVRDLFSAEQLAALMGKP